MRGIAPAQEPPEDILAAIMRALEPEERQAAQERERRGGRGKGSGKLPDPLKGRSRDQVARYVGVSGRTLEKMAEVLKLSPGDYEEIYTRVQAGEPHEAVSVLNCAGAGVRRYQLGKALT